MRKTFHKFGFDLANLNEWVNEQELPLLTKSLFDNDAARHLVPMTGVKHKQALNLLDDAIHFRTPSCGFAASGDTVLSQREMFVGGAEVNKSWCIRELEEFWTQMVLPAGSIYKDLPLEAVMLNLIAGLIAEKIGIAIWQADRSSGDPDLNKWDGLMKQINTSAAFIPAVNTGITSITSSNAIQVIDNVVAALPKGLRKKRDIGIFVGWDVFQDLLVNLRNTNNFHINGADENPYESGILKSPTWGIPIIAQFGLEDTNTIYAMRSSNGFLGTDLQGEEDSFEVWYEKKDDAVLARARFKYGTQVGRPNEIVRFVPATN
jgi:hypothetical protein